MSPISSTAESIRPATSIRLRVRILLLVCGLSSGCAQTASVQCWQPAGIADGNLQRLAVVGAADDVDRQAATALEEQIRRDGKLDVVSYDESGIIPAGYLEDERLLGSGAEADVDAIVRVDVQDYEVAPAPRRRWSWDSLWGTNRVWNAEVRVGFELIDTRTNEVLATREIARTEATDRGPRSDVSHEVLNELVRECVDEFVSELEPRETESVIELAEGRWYSLSGSLVHRGVSLARRGRWEQAEDAWRKALARNADNDAALFNLAVASAHAGDFAAAEDFAMEALRIRHTECYAAGLEQIRDLRTASEESEEQLMRTAVVPAGFMDRADSLVE